MARAINTAQESVVNSSFLAQLSKAFLILSVYVMSQMLRRLRKPTGSSPIEETMPLHCFGPERELLMSPNREKEKEKEKGRL